DFLRLCDEPRWGPGVQVLQKIDERTTVASQQFPLGLCFGQVCRDGKWFGAECRVQSTAYGIRRMRAQTGAAAIRARMLLQPFLRGLPTSLGALLGQSK